MQDRDSAEIAKKMITPLQPREFFRGNGKEKEDSSLTLF
jgi:hypothetical protein